MEEIENQYREMYPTFSKFTKRLEELIKIILDTSDIKYHLIESRTKSVESFCEKVRRKQEKYTDPINDITDTSALRIIVFYIKDLEKIEELLKKNFKIDTENSFNAKNNLSENQFGYLSSHFVVSLKNDRSKLAEWAPYKNLKAEFQIRTVLQHTWAAISHELEYKKTYDIPSILKRKLFRLAGLIELADEEFQIVKEEHHSVELSIKQKKPLNKIKVFEEINLNTIQNYFATTPKSLKIIEANAIEAGFEIENNDEYLVEKRNKYLSDIIEICNLKGISNINDFKQLLTGIASSSKMELINLYKIENRAWIISIEFAILLILVATLNEKQIEAYGGKGWGPVGWQKLKRYVIGKKLP